MGTIATAGAFSETLLVFNGGQRVSRATEALADGETTLFTVAGGRALIVGLVGEVTTAVTVANEAKLVFDPTATGADQDMCAVLDIGTTDSPVGSLLTISGTVGDAMRIDLLIGNPMLTNPLLVSEGEIHLNNAGTSVDGAIAWTVIYVPLDDGATVVAA